MRFSVVIPIHNSEKTLALALDSVHLQSFGDFETVIVDDNSSDRSVEIASSHPLHCRIIRLEETQGPGKARNIGAIDAKGSYLVFLDSDDHWFPWTLATLDRAIQEYPGASFVSGTDSRKHTSKAKLSNFEANDIKVSKFQNYFESLQENFWIGVGSVAVKTSSFSKVGGFAEWGANSEDSDLWLRLGTEPIFLRISNPPLFTYSQSGGSLTQNTERIASGYSNLVGKEKQGCYPGGVLYRKQRLILLTRHTRAATFHLLELRRLREAGSLYFATIYWNFQLIRIKYLVGFWILYFSRLITRA